MHMHSVMNTDAETGEWNPDAVCFDQETGEMFDYSYLANQPMPLLNVTPRTADPQRQHSEVPHPEQRRTRRRKSIGCCIERRRREITLGYNPTHKLFLIPSLFMFFRITALVLMFCELVLHIWAHRKNAQNTDDRVFYRSPLHLITSQFCAKCTSHTGMIKLGIIQDRRREAKRLLAFSGSVH